MISLRQDFDHSIRTLDLEVDSTDPLMPTNVSLRAYDDPNVVGKACNPGLQARFGRHKGLPTSIEECSHHANPVSTLHREPTQQLLELDMTHQPHRPGGIQRSLHPTSGERTRQQENRQSWGGDWNAAQSREVLRRQVAVVVDHRQPVLPCCSLPRDQCVHGGVQPESGQTPPLRRRPVRQVGASR